MSMPISTQVRPKRPQGAYSPEVIFTCLSDPRWQRVVPPETRDQQGREWKRRLEKQGSFDRYSQQRQRARIDSPDEFNYVLQQEQQFLRMLRQHYGLLSVDVESPTLYPVKGKKLDFAKVKLANIALTSRL
jgi:hypothetical protein